MLDLRNHGLLMKWMERHGIVLCVPIEIMLKHLSVPFVTPEKERLLGENLALHIFYIIC